jgi:S-adenosyl methyltransferase
VYDYWLGGKDNFAADRDAAEQVLAAYPDIRHGVRANRAFLGRAVRFLAGEAGIRQFLDIGTGIPTENNTHQVAQAAAPESRIVYVDNDPMVLSHARALFFDGLELQEPGVVTVSQWRPESDAAAVTPATLWAGVARKP